MWGIQEHKRLNFRPKHLILTLLKCAVGLQLNSFILCLRWWRWWWQALELCHYMKLINPCCCLYNPVDIHVTSFLNPVNTILGSLQFHVSYLVLVPQSISCKFLWMAQWWERNYTFLSKSYQSSFTYCLIVLMSSTERRPGWVELWDLCYLRVLSVQFGLGKVQREMAVGLSSVGLTQTDLLTLWSFLHMVCVSFSYVITCASEERLDSLLETLWETLRLWPDIRNAWFHMFWLV